MAGATEAGRFVLIVTLEQCCLSACAIRGGKNMTWFTEHLAIQDWRAIADGDNQAMIGFRDGRTFVGPLATMPISETEDDDDEQEVYPADQDDLRRINAVLALPKIAKLFREILDAKLSIDVVKSQVQSICDVIEDTQELSTESFEIELSLGGVEVRWQPGAEQSH